MMPALEDDYAQSVAEERNQKFRFGIRKWSPDCLQIFRHPIAFTTFLFLEGVLEGAIVSGLLSVVITSIETRYGLTSIMTGLLASLFDVVVVLCVLPISYFSENSHKPRWLGIGAVVQGVGAILFALPQFVGGPYIAEALASDTDFCGSNVDFSKDCNATSNLWVYMIFMLAVVLLAIGATPLFTVGIAFIDDIAWPKKVSVYLGVFQSSVIIGPAVGYVIGGALLSLYVDPWIRTPLTSSDPSFVGAWWAGFVILGILMLIISIPLLMYPREIPESDKIRQEREKSTTMKQLSSKKSPSFKSKVKNFPRELALILSSPSWLLVTLTGGLTYLILTGFASFGPKYVEVQFSVSSTLASYGVGGVGVVFGGLGILTGGLVVSCMKGSGKKASLATFVVTFISTISTVGFFLNCPNTIVNGIPNNTSFGYLLHQPSTGTPDYGAPQCVADCNCTSSLYQPVCHKETQLTYYSPCHAGCSAPPDGTIYRDCACVNVNSSTAANVNSSRYAAANVNSSTADTVIERGKCGQCFLFIPFLILLGGILFVTFTALVPITIVTVRSVGEEQRCTALGLQSVLFRSLGGIPGPLSFGAIFDSTCILWQHECGARGNCWEYNNHQLKFTLFAYSFSVCAVRTVTMLFAWVYFGRNYCCTKIAEATDSDPDSHNGTRNDSNKEQDAYALTNLAATETGI